MIFYRIIPDHLYWALEMRNEGESDWYRIQLYDKYRDALKDKRTYEGIIRG